MDDQDNEVLESLDNEENQEQEQDVEESSEEVDEETQEEPEEEIDLDKLEVEKRTTVAPQEIDFGDDIDPDDIKTIGTIVDKKLAAVGGTTQEIKDTLEVDNYLADKPELKKYKPAILKYMKDDAYKNVPVRFIAAGLASNELMKLGAKAEREAQIKADSTKTKGNPVRRQAGARDWTKVSSEEFEAHKRQVLGQR